MLDKLLQNSYIRALLVLSLGFVMLDFLFALLFGTANAAQRYLSVSYLMIQILVWVLVGGFFYGVYILAREFLTPAVRNLEFFLPEAARCSQCQRIVRNSWACCPYCGSVSAVEGS